MKHTKKEDIVFVDRDLSWLSFNERVLAEAQNEAVPLMDRIRFLSIFSSNLDEFYRVRMPVLMALRNVKNSGSEISGKVLLNMVNEKIRDLQRSFGGTIETQIIPALRENHIRIIYNEAIPVEIRRQVREYFLNVVASYIQIIHVSAGQQLFPENNKLYFAILCDKGQKGRKIFVICIPSDILTRFYKITHDEISYVLFLDDIIRDNLREILPQESISGCYAFKVTRDAELDLKDEFSGNLAEKIEKNLAKRDRGRATRFLHEPGIATKVLHQLIDSLGLEGALIIPGGRYHNLKDLANLGLTEPKHNYVRWSPVVLKMTHENLFDEIKSGDRLVHPPYHSYESILRFFNEASLNPQVKNIYVTLYRVATDSRIVSALISAARNGKKVMVFVELKARFDEENNIKWSKRMKAAGIRIIESIPGLKVHAKLALVELKDDRKPYRGLIATGNFNESTARFYTDHVLMTSNTDILSEVEALFVFLKKRKKPRRKKNKSFDKLLVGHFNLLDAFIDLIEREIKHAKAGKKAEIRIKLNNLEERVLIGKLYEASKAGVKIDLIVRSICCLAPGVKGLSENISVTRIVDRYLEHGRIFFFCNDGNPEVYIGSSDWMERNIYRRIEVVVPLLDDRLKSQVIEMLNLQWRDRVKGVIVDCDGNNVQDGVGSTESSQTKLAQLVSGNRG